MGYRKYAKDYEIEYVQRPGKKRPKAVRVYIGPYFRFSVPQERISWLRRYYLIALCLAALCLLLPMCVDGPFARVWYVLTPLAAAWLPWIYAAAAIWRLWTAGEKVEREHYELLHDRMNGASLFLMGLSAISAVGCILRLGQTAPTGADILICICCLGAVASGAAMFARRRELEMEAIDQNSARG